METRVLLLLMIIFSSVLCLSQDDPSSEAPEGILTDGRDGQEYRWVRIGDQVWMAQNLNIGDLVVIRNNEISSIVLVERYCYDDKPAYCKKFGGLYTDNTILHYLDGESSQSICPAGWHLPSEDEWMQLLNHLGGPEMAGGALKDTVPLWQGKVDKTATNSTGFSALPGGCVIYDENAFAYAGVGKFCYFWTSNETYSLIYSHHGLRTVCLLKNKMAVRIEKSMLGTACSVRCVKD